MIKFGINKQFRDQNFLFGVGYIRGAAFDDFPIHTHGFTELVIIMKGRGSHWVEGSTYQIVPGDVFVFKGEQAHGFKGIRGAHMVNLSFVPSSFPPVPEEFKTLPGYNALFTLEPVYRRQRHFQSRLSLSRGQLTFVENLVMRMESEQSACPPGWREMLKALFLELIIYLSRCYEGIQGGEELRMLELGGILSFMEGHYAERLNLPKLAKRANMSVNNFLRVFKKASGFTPMEYLLRLRIGGACTRLLASPQRIADVALATGFNDSNYFSRQFRLVTGLSPREFRRSPKAQEIKAGLFLGKLSSRKA
ncbi:MAG: hypothetical protein A2X49_16705 [Lentisphaerae bacterium GWF2_52_8]|nr:MAG: hypothetical protein A2X49_16705 [Lentisphaerae bacterium GWF2_52_8]